MWAAWLLVWVGCLLVPGVPGAGMGWMTVSPSGRAVPMQDQVSRGEEGHFYSSQRAVKYKIKVKHLKFTKEI